MPESGIWETKATFPKIKVSKSTKEGTKQEVHPGGYYSPYKNPKLSDGPEGEYLTDRLTNESIQFLTLSKNLSFFYFQFYSVHTPIQPNKKYIDKFNKKLKQLDIDETAVKKEGKGITTLDQHNAAYASMLFALDKNIGKLVKNLKERGLYENTTLVFTSDNGGLSTLSKSRNHKAPTSVLPLRAGKGWLYEGGIRVPLLIKPSHYSGEARSSAEPIVGHDFYPTLLSMAGIEVENNIILDGIDLSPLIHENKSLERVDLFWHYQKDLRLLVLQFVWEIGN